MTPSHDQRLPARLPDLARAINDAHEECERAVRSGLGYALKAGGLLLEAKRLCPHGAWGAWLAENFRGSERTAQAYMRVAKLQASLPPGPNPQRAADLPLRDALRLLADPAPDKGATLEDSETRIEAGLGGFLAVAESIRAVRDAHLYRQSHKSFEDYCRSKIGLEPGMVEEFLGVADLMTAGSTTGEGT